MLGLIDTAIIGHLGSAVYLGAIALGALIFSFVYWGFGFLRMGTTGLSAQAFGADDRDEVCATLQRAAILGVGIGVVLILLQWPLSLLVFRMLGGSAEVEAVAETYYAIRIWGAPATFCTYAITGWFIGLQKTKTALLLNVFLNSANAALDSLFVLGLDWGVAGVAAGSLIAEILTVVLGLMLVVRTLNANGWPVRRPDWAVLLAPDRLAQLVTVNRDIFIRTLALIFAFAWFTNQSALAGDVTIAANFILLQLVSFAAFFLDGFAHAAEALVGRAIGARSRRSLLTAAGRSAQLAGVTAVILSCVFGLYGPAFIGLLTNVSAVRETAEMYLMWVVAVPIIAVWCYLLDGIFIGATQSQDMRNMALVSLGAYLAAHFAFTAFWGNHGLWAAFIVFQSVRGITLALRLPALIRGRIPADASPARL